MSKIYAIGNPLLDILINIEDELLTSLKINKGIMHLIDLETKDFLVSKTINQSTSYFCGGSAPNTIIALASLGISATLAGKIGSDKEGNIYRDKLDSLGIKNSLIVDKDNKTGSTIILISKDGERTMNTYLGANRFFSEEDVREEDIKECSIFHFTAYMFDTPSQKKAILRALKYAKKYNLTISFDLADSFAVNRNKEEFLNLIKDYIDIVFANKMEAISLLGCSDLSLCAKELSKLCKISIIKDGKRGSYVATDDNVYKIAVRGPVTPVDTTGAGDMYAAGFLYGYMKNYSLIKSANIASFLAGKIICQIGAQFLDSDLDEINQEILKI